MSGKQRTVAVSEAGQMDLPAEMRQALGLKGAGSVLLIEEEDGFRITTLRNSLRQLRGLAAAYRPKDSLASENLIADRRSESAGDE